MKAVALLALVAFIMMMCAVSEARPRTALRGGHKIDWSKVDTQLMDAKFGRKLVDQPAKRSADAPSDSSLWEVIPGRYPKTQSLPDVLAQVPNTPEGRKFVQDLANTIFTKFGIWVPSFVVDLFFEDSSYFLNYLKFTGWELYDGIAAINFAYQMGWITSNATKVDTLPQGYNLDNYASAPINVSNYIPAEPVELFPNLWKGFYRGNATEEQLKAEIVVALTLNQLANNSHKRESDPSTYFTLYNGNKIASIRDLLSALASNGHSIKCYLTYRAVDFFGLLTRDSQGQFKEVPAPVFMDTEITSLSGESAVTTAIHDELVIEIRSGPNTKGTPFNIDILWYEGDDGIGFFAGSLYDYASWVGVVNTQHMEGKQAIDYLHLAGVFSDTLIQTALTFNLYDLGYGATGVCVDSIAVIEWTVYGNMSLYPLLMEKYLVAPIVAEYLALANRNAGEYAKLAAGLYELASDSAVNPTLRQRAYNTITWPAGQEPFETVVKARAILSGQN